MVARHSPGYPLAGRACAAAGLPGRGTAFFPKKAVGKKGPRGIFPPAPPKKRGFMAAVRCVWPAKTSRASPPVLLSLMLQALPRLGRHASGLLCNP